MQSACSPDRASPHATCSGGTQEAFALISPSCSQALSYMDEDFMIQLEGFYEDKVGGHALWLAEGVRVGSFIVSA